jgi:hypothetical protein
MIRQRDVIEVRIANDIDGGQATVSFAASLLTLILTGRGFSKPRRTKRVALFAGLPGLGLRPVSTRSRRKITSLMPLSWRRKSEITSVRFSPLPHGLVPLRMRTQRIRRLRLCRLLDLGPRVFTRCRDACLGALVQRRASPAPIRLAARPPAGSKSRAGVACLPGTWQVVKRVIGASGTSSYSAPIQVAAHC